MTLANYLYALVYSNIYDESNWQAWAANILKGAKYDNDTEWVYEVCLATDKQKLFEVIAERMFCEDYLIFNSHVLTEIIQGYYYCQCLDRTISLYEMLEKSGDVADAGQDARGCEFFYGLLNKIDKDPSIVNSADFLEIISEYYSPLYAAAMGQKRKLETATIEDLKLHLL